MPKFLQLLLCAAAFLGFQGCQTLAGDTARSDAELKSYVQGRWLAFAGAPGGTAAEPAMELFCLDGGWKLNAGQGWAVGTYTVKASQICVTEDGGKTSCRHFTRSGPEGYVASAGPGAGDAVAVRPEAASANSFATNYSCATLGALRRAPMSLASNR
ncbi:hypothetical protein [Phenylobacterium sp.]|uniref:hypothetical protein n=1 Tax=Phenylobacterium sp. TaxID=1871053 RepID=UPI003567771A